jgi:hypothetical protein
LYEIKTYLKAEPSSKKHIDQMQLGMYVHGTTRCVYVTYRARNDDETSDAVVDPANIKLQVIEADAGWQKDFLDRATK